jgi:hypothetical protein
MLNKKQLPGRDKTTEEMNFRKCDIPVSVVPNDTSSTVQYRIALFSEKSRVKHAIPRVR